MSETMKDIERQVGRRMREVVDECHRSLLSVEDTIADVVGSPLVGNGLQTALSDLRSEVEKLSERVPGLYDKVRERFGTYPEDDELDEAKD